MAMDSSSQLVISMSDMRHIIHVNYPIFHLVDASEDEKPCLYAPDDLEDRYEPCNLVPEPDIVRNSSFSKVQETRFFTLVSAGTESVRRDLIPVTTRYGSRQFNNFMLDVASVSRRLGSTSLAVATFVSESSGIDYVRVRRTTESHDADGTAMRSYATHTFRMEDLSTCKLFPSVLQTIWHLVKRGSDRAVRHVDVRVKMQGFCENTKWGWKMHRGIRHEHLLRTTAALVDISDLRANDRCCHICNEEYDGSNGSTDPKTDPHRAVRLPCGHVFGANCLVMQFALREQGGRNSISQLSMATCPLCGQSPVDPNVLLSLRFGLTDGIYHHDDRFSDFENFERSCADLDNFDWTGGWQLETPTIRAEVLKGAWRLLIQGARLEDDVSTPYHLQQARFPELEIATQAIDAIFDRENGKQVCINDLLESTFEELGLCLTEAYDNNILRMCRRNCRLDFDPEENLESILKPSLSIVRPSLVQWLVRNLYRTLRFQQCRSCICQPRFHQHGVRTYYNAWKAHYPIIEGDSHTNADLFFGESLSYDQTSGILSST